MIVVVDTNVLVSGLLSPFNAPGRILQLIASGHVRLAYDARILSEYAAVLARSRFAFATQPRESLLEQIRSRGVLTMSVPLPRSLPDATDNPFLEVALGAAASCLITGNQKHYPARLCEGITVVLPAAFLKLKMN